MRGSDYRSAVQNLSRPATEEEKTVEMMAMFLCESGIIPLAGNGGSRRSGGHGWHRANEKEREEYRRRAVMAPADMPRDSIVFAQ